MTNEEMPTIGQIWPTLTKEQQAELDESFRQMLKSQKVLPRKLRIRRSK